MFDLLIEMLQLSEKNGQYSQVTHTVNVHNTSRVKSIHLAKKAKHIKPVQVFKPKVKRYKVFNHTFS